MITEFIVKEWNYVANRKEISDFTVQAYVDNVFKTVTKADILSKLVVFFFYPADFTFVWKPGAKILKPSLDLVGMI